MATEYNKTAQPLFDLENVVGQLAAVRQEWRAAQQRSNEPGGRELPSRDALIDILRGLKGVLFPMRLGPTDLRQESEDFYVGHTLGAVLHALRSQVRLELHYTARHQESVDSAALDAQALNLHNRQAFRNELYKRGVFFIVLDESQVAAAGKTAGAAYVRNLLLLRDLGVPLIYVCNYSMALGLKQQHAQNQHRLLQNPFWFRRAPLDDPDFTAMVSAYVEACNGLLSDDLTRSIADIHRLTDGRGRLLRLLIVMAYLLQREKGINGRKLVIGPTELIGAYRHPGFRSMRDEVEQIARHRIETSGLRSDLLYPFAEEYENSEQACLIAKQALEAAAAHASIRDAMPPKKVKTQIAPGPGVPAKRPARRIGVGATGVRPAGTNIKPADSGQSSNRSTHPAITDEDVDTAWS